MFVAGVYQMKENILKYSVAPSQPTEPNPAHRVHSNVTSSGPDFFIITPDELFFLNRVRVNKACRGEYKKCFRIAKNFLHKKGIIVAKFKEIAREFLILKGVRYTNEPEIVLLKLYLDNKPKNKKIIEKRKFIEEAYGSIGSPGIYCITCVKNKKRYIGSSSNIEARWLSHSIDLKNNKHPNKRIQADFNLYKETDFRFEIIVVAQDIDRIELYELEQRYIDKLNPEYNIQRKVYAPPPGSFESFYRHREIKPPKLAK